MFSIMQKFKLTYISYQLLHYVTEYYKIWVTKQKHQIYSFSITPYVITLRDFLVGHSKSTQDDDWYSVQPPEPDLIQQADTLFREGKYMEVYGLLNQLRYCSNVEVLWRMSRALFAMSRSESLTTDIRNEMIKEAYQLINVAVMKDDNAEAHKWMAILMDHTMGNINTSTRTKAMMEVKNHLLRATELDPTDVITLYMLGHWCYQLANLTWFQRKLASFLFVSPPSSSFEEAYYYFLKAEQLKPGFFIGNTYMLGKVSYHMKQCYRAKYYLDIAASLPCRTEQERKYNHEAKKLSHELYHYDLSKAALFYEK